MKNQAPIALLAALLVRPLVGCNDEALIETGTYTATDSSLVPAGEWDSAKTITADVNRDTETVVFTLADGSKMSLHITSLPEDQWQGGCATFGTHTDEEVVTLSPGPITLADLTFTRPALAAAGCSSNYLSLTEVDDPVETKWVSFDRVK